MTVATYFRRCVGVQKIHWCLSRQQSARLVSDRLPFKWFISTICLVLLAQFANTNAKPAYTAEELAWIQQHPLITLAIDNTYPPLNFVDQNGNMAGLCVDYVNATARKAGVAIAYQGSLWSVAINKALNHAVDGIVNADASEKRKDRLNFTLPYATLPSGVVTLKTAHDLESISKMDGKRICVKKNSSRFALISESTQADVIPIETLEEGLERVIKGEAFGVFDEVSVLGYLISKYNFSNLKINFIHYDDIVGVSRIGLRNDDPILLSVFNKAILNLTQEEKDEIQSKWISRFIEKHFDWSRFFKIVAPLIAVGLFFFMLAFLHNRRLKNVVENRTHDLRKSEERYRRIFENSVVGFFQSTPEGRFITVNPAFARMLGYDSPEDLITSISNITEQYYEKPDHREKYLQILNKKGTVSNLEFTARKKDGSIIWFSKSTRAYFDSSGNVTHYEGVVSDITDRKRMEADLKESEERYRSLVENTIDGYFIAEIPSGAFIFFNQSICNLFEYTVQEAQRLTFWDVIDPKEHSIIKERITERLKVRQPSFATNTYTAVRKSGSKFRAEVFTSVVTYSGKPAFQGVLRNVTENERLQLQLQQAQKMESVGRLAGGVAHDFNNMLGVIIGHTELALGQVSTSSPVHGDLEEIQKAANRSADLTKQLLAFARKQTASPEILDLNEKVSSMINMLRRLIGEDINLTLEADPNLWPVKIDRAQADQIMANLCVNARDAIAGIGNISIRTKNVILDENYCQKHEGCKSGPYVRIAVYDDGCGMDPTTREKIFEPFFTTKKPGEGTGLGLSTVYGIVKQNEGYIEVESIPGKGSTFYIYLPRTEEIAVNSERPAMEPALSGNETILIVEDEKSILHLAKAILERFGYTVLTACAPAKAMDLVRRHKGPIHLLIIDVVMPQMNGAILKKEIEKIKPDVKTVFMSGYTADIVASQGILNRDVAFLQKPFSIDSLARKAREVLDSKK